MCHEGVQEVYLHSGWCSLLVKVVRGNMNSWSAGKKGVSARDGEEGKVGDVGV